jgi:CubicO group peptidase (beta-lactamase class C family)
VNSSTHWSLPFADAKDVGVSPDRLATIRPALQKYIDQQKVPNLVSLVARHGKIIFFEAQGYMDLNSHKPVQRDTIFRLWSNSKPIAGVATMICVEDGLFSLEDPVSKYIPAFKNQVVRIDDVEWLRQRNCFHRLATATVPAIREITIRDCLCNTTGLPTIHTAPIAYITEYPGIIEETGLLNAPDKQPDSIRKMVEALAKLPLDSQPGKRFVYQAGYPIIGLIIEMVTGKSLEDFYKDRIFRPLGMNDTSFYLPKDKLNRFSTCYCPTLKNGNWELVVMERPEESERFKGPNTYFEAGGGRGGVISTAGDYARLAQMLLNGGQLDGARILSRKSVELMISNHTGDVYPSEPGPPGFGFGLGVGVYKGGNPSVLRSVGTYGWTGACGTSYFADPKEDLICIIFTQVLMHRTILANDYQEEFERLVYAALI